MFAAMRAQQTKKYTPPPVTAASISVPNTSPIYNTAQTVTCDVTGGVAPYTYRLYRHDGTLITSGGASSTSYGLNYTADLVSNSLYCTVTDSYGSVGTSSSTALSVHYMLSCNATYYWSGFIGTSANLYANAACDPFPAIQWYYRDAKNAGSWVTWATNAVATTGAINYQDIWEFYFTATNDAGTLTSNTITIYG